MIILVINQSKKMLKSYCIFTTSIHGGHGGVFPGGRIILENSKVLSFAKQLSFQLFFLRLNTAGEAPEVRSEKRKPS